MKKTILFLSLLVMSLPAAAQERQNAFDISPKETVSEYNKRTITAITENDIREFARIQTNLHEGSYEDYLAFINARFTDDVISNDKVTTVFENQPSKNADNRATKQDVLNEAEGVYTLIQGAQINNNIDKIEIAPDRQTAIVYDTTSYFNEVAKDVNSAERTTIKMNSKCVNKFRISDKKLLQLAASDCQTVMNVKQ